MTTTKIRTPEALYPTLDNFHRINGKSFHAAWNVYTDGSLGKLVLQFGSDALMIVADENDDSIDITVEDMAKLTASDAVDGSNLDPWKHFIGKEFGWGWVTVNQQGYTDGLLLSFGGIVPQILLNVIASSIKVSTISIQA